MARVQKPDLKVMEAQDVSYAELCSTDDRADAVQNVATAINVQFTGFSETLPFVPPKQFATLLREEKVFVVGPSGSGKSRTIIEILRSKNPTYDRIFVINPSNPAGIRSERESILKLVQRFRQNDIVIWDNFPDGMVRRDLESAFGALEILNESLVQNLCIALKPTYLELYRGLTTGIPDFYTTEITCDLETIKSLLKEYGKVEQYQGLFKLVSPNIDRIARVLWEKQPLSLTVIDYYKALLDKSAIESSMDDSMALQMAEAWLPAYDYFERQFEVMKKMPTRKDDVEFLYILRFCYEVGSERTHALLTRLQKEIFASESPAEPTLQLGTWLYFSGQNYSMHDSAKNAVKLTDHSRMNIASYLARHFSDIAPAAAGELHSLGLFIGRNIEFLPIGSGPTIVPEKIYQFMKRSAVFERAIGRGVGENFEQLDETLQEQMLLLVDTEIEFGSGLADSLGERFTDLDDFNRKRVMDKTYQGMLFARYFGQSVGRLYPSLSDDLKSMVRSNAEKNSQFADGLGMGLGFVYTALDQTLQHEILSKANSNFDMSRGIGFGLGLTFGLLGEDDARKVVAIADNSSELDVGLGMGMAVSYASLQEKLRNFVLGRTATDAEFAFGVGVYSAYSYKECCPPELFDLLSSNTEFANGLGLGYGPILFYLPEKFHAQLEALMKENVRLDDGVGAGIGLVLKHFSADVQLMIFGKASTRNAFALGLGYGVGYTWQYAGDGLRKRSLEFAGSNSEFARGLGLGFGCHLDYLEPRYLAEALSIANSNSELDAGLGAGAAWAWPYFKESAREIARHRLDTRTEFARGMGLGLARVTKQLARNKMEEFMGRLNRDQFFLKGFSEGTGQYLWSVYGNQEKEDFLNRTSVSAEASTGLGAGIGFLYTIFKSELETGALEAFLKKNPDLRRGLGAGMGRAYKYLGETSRVQAFRMAGQDIEFAAGLGRGMATIYNYLDDSEKGTLWSNLGDNAFSTGVGLGLGSIFGFLGDEARNKLLTAAPNNRQLSFGLGTGIAMNLPYLVEAVGEKMFELAKDNPFLAAGLGEGCAMTFQKMSSTIKNWVSSHEVLDDFALGFGLGIGKIRKYLNESNFDEASIFVKGTKFTEGFGLGLGSSAVQMQENLLRAILSSRTRDDTFARHFGYGLGHVLSQLGVETRNQLLNMMKENQEFLAGLGEGIGHNLPVTGSQFVQEIMDSSRSVNLTKGAAQGLSDSFEYLNIIDVLGILEHASSNREYGKVLGRGCAEKFAFLSEEIQLQIISALQKDSAFSREFAKVLPDRLEYLTPQARERIKELFSKFQHLGHFQDRSEGSV